MDLWGAQCKDLRSWEGGEVGMEKGRKVGLGTWGSLGSLTKIEMEGIMRLVWVKGGEKENFLHSYSLDWHLTRRGGLLPIFLSCPVSAPKLTNMVSQM